MRRKDREVTEVEEIRQILDGCKVCRVGMIEDGKVYIVPMNMAYELENGKLILYFHCAKEGRKLEIIKKNPTVGFEMDQEIGLVKGDTPCQYSFRYASVIGTGIAKIVEDEQEKVSALTKVMKQQTGKDFTDFTENPKLLSTVCILEVESDEYTCKKNK